MVKYFSENMKIEPGTVAYACILRIPSVEAEAERSQVQGQPVQENGKCSKSSYFSTSSAPAEGNSGRLSISVTRRNVLAGKETF